MGNKKIEVFYRDVYYPADYVHNNKIRPYWFGFDKSYSNFLSTKNTDLVRMTVVNDMKRAPVDYESGCVRVIEEGEVECRVSCGTDQGSFLELMKIIEAKNFDPETIVYIVENDYLHRPGWSEILIEGFSTGADYVTLYDHPDKYTDYTDLTSRVFVTQSCHWRTTPSTTNTFAVKYKTLMADMDLHKYYAEFGIQGLAHDHTKFLSLAERGRTLISSIPGYSTHCNNYLSPCTDWGKLINNE